jgi:hypothetical protein
MVMASKAWKYERRLAVVDDDIDIDEDQEIAFEIGQWTPKAQSVFWAYVENVLSGSPISEVALCKKIGVSRSYLYKLKTKSTWTKAFQRLAVNGAINRTLANTDKYISNLERLAEEDVSANKVLLNVSGVLKQAGGISINLNESKLTSSKNPIELLDEFLISMGKAGVTADFILNRYIELKNQNAF